MRDKEEETFIKQKNKKRNDGEHVIFAVTWPERKREIVINY